MREALQLQSVFAHPLFQAKPLEALQEHLQNTYASPPS
jgi:hypothetical protein